MSLRRLLSLLTIVFFILGNPFFANAFEGLEHLEKEEERVPGENDRNYCLRLRAYNDCQISSVKTKKKELQDSALETAYKCYIQKQMQAPSQKKLKCDLGSEKQRAKSISSPE